MGSRNTIINSPTSEQFRPIVTIQGAGWSLVASFSEVQTLSEPYTTKDLMHHCLTAVSEEPYQQTGEEWDVATRIMKWHLVWLYDYEWEVWMVGGVYRIQFKGEPGVKYKLNWIERFVSDEDGSVIDSIKTEDVVGNGQIQYTREHKVNPANENGWIVLVCQKSPGAKPVNRRQHDT